MKKSLLIVLKFISLFLFVFAIQCDAQTVRYVKAGASGDGSSWMNASGDLQVMMNASAANDMVWVAGGTYKPEYRADNMSGVDPNNRFNAFVLKKDVKIYGGFAGTEISLADRDLTQTVNVSILSGDIGTVGVNTDNSFHVVISAGNVGTAELNGFTIKDGNANSILRITVNSLSINSNYGGGIYNIESSPLLTNVIVSENSASSVGGGIYNQSSSSPALSNVTVSGNSATFEGGGIYNIESSPVLTNVIISGNTARQGAGIYNQSSSSPSLSDVTISGNSAVFDGGGIYNIESSPILTNVTISGNTGRHGAGINNESSSSSVLSNLIIIGNIATGNGGGIFNIESSPVLTNVNFSENTARNGAGISNQSSSSPVLTNVTVSGNSATFEGGGIYNVESSPLLTSVTISGNNARHGGGISNQSTSSPILTNVTVNGNSATFEGGGIYNAESSPILTNVTISGNNARHGGGISNQSSSSPVLTNVTVSGNSATFDGGGIYNEESSPILTNVTLSGNKAGNGGAIANSSSSPKIRNSIIYGNSSRIHNSSSSPVIEYSLVQGSLDITNGNIEGNIDPLFINPLPAGLNTGGNYRLKAGSPVIGMGNNTYFNVGQTPDLSSIMTDPDGNPRIKDAAIDLGAYENQTSALPVMIISFTAKGEGRVAKLEWETATETNNKEFIVSRSADGVSFHKIGRVEAAGNSSGKKGYVFYDNLPASGINYYHLNQRDLDGKVTSHGIRAVRFSLKKDAVKIYPNPVKDVLRVEFSAGLYHQVEIMDNTGKVLQRVSLSKIEKEKILRMDHYPEGAYYIRLKGSGKEQVEKIVRKK